MITHDIRYGWRLMVRKPAFHLVGGADARPRHRRQRERCVSWVNDGCAHLLAASSGDRLVALNGTTRTRSELSSRQFPTSRTIGGACRRVSRISSPTRCCP